MARKTRPQRRRRSARRASRPRRGRPAAHRPPTAKKSSRPFWRFLADKSLRADRTCRHRRTSRRFARAVARRISPPRLRSLPPISKRPTARCSRHDVSDMAEEPERERLFDVLMRRLEILAPHRDAVRSLLRSAPRNPPLALALNGLAVRSQQWMLTAAGIGASGPRGMVRAQGLAVLFASGAAHLGRRRRSRPCADHGGARSGARPRSAPARLAGGCLRHSGAALRLRPRRRRRRDEDYEETAPA